MHRGESLPSFCDQSPEQAVLLWGYPTSPWAEPLNSVTSLNDWFFSLNMKDFSQIPRENSSGSKMGEGRKQGHFYQASRLYELQMLATVGWQKLPRIWQVKPSCDHLALNNEAVPICGWSACGTLWSDSVCSNPSSAPFLAWGHLLNLFVPEILGKRINKIGLMRAPTSHGCFEDDIG